MDVLFFLQFVGRSGDGFLIGIVVLPVADGNAQAPADAGDAVFFRMYRPIFLSTGCMDKTASAVT